MEKNYVQNRNEYYNSCLDILKGSMTCLLGTTTLLPLKKSGVINGGFDMKFFKIKPCDMKNGVHYSLFDHFAPAIHFQ